MALDDFQNDDDSWSGASPPTYPPSTYGGNNPPYGSSGSGYGQASIGATSPTGPSTPRYNSYYTGTYPPGGAPGPTKPSSTLFGNGDDLNGHAGYTRSNDASDYGSTSLGPLYGSGPYSMESVPGFTQRDGWNNLVPKEYRASNVPLTFSDAHVKYASNPLSASSTASQPFVNPATLPPTLTDDINRTHQSNPKRSLIGDPKTGISSATFIDPNSGRQVTYFYGGNADGSMYGRRLDPKDPRVQQAVRNDPTLTSGIYPNNVGTMALGRKVLHFQPFDPRTNTYRYLFSDIGPVYFDRNFNPVDTAKENYYGSGVYQKDSLAPGDYYGAAAVDRANQIQQGIRNVTKPLAKAASSFLTDIVHASHDMGNAPSKPRQDEQWFGNTFGGNTVTGLGNMAASSPDAVAGTLNMAGQEGQTAKLKVEGTYNRWRGNLKEAKAEDALRERINNEIVAEMAGFYRSTFDSFGGTGRGTPLNDVYRAVAALNARNPRAALLFMNDAVSATGRNILKDPAAAIANFFILRDGVKAFASPIAVADASLRGAMMKNMADDLDRAAAAAERTDPTAAAAARAKARELRVVEGSIAQARSAYAARQRLAATREAAAHPERGRYVSSADAAANKPRTVQTGREASTPHITSPTYRDSGGSHVVPLTSSELLSGEVPRAAGADPYAWMYDGIPSPYRYEVKPPGEPTEKPASTSPPPSTKPTKPISTTPEASAKTGASGVSGKSPSWGYGPEVPWTPFTNGRWGYDTLPYGTISNGRIVPVPFDWRRDFYGKSVFEPTRNGSSELVDPVVKKTLAEWLVDDPDLLDEARRQYRDSPHWQGIDPDNTPVFYRQADQVKAIRKKDGRSGGHHPHGLALGGPAGQKLTVTGDTRTWKHPEHTKATNLQNRIRTIVKGSD